MICTPGNFSHKKETEKVESLSRPGGHANVESDVALGLVDLLIRLLPLPLGHGAGPEGALVVNIDVPVLKQGPGKTKDLGKS